MFDFEHGSQSLGSKDHIEKTLGYPLLTPSTWDQFQGVIGNLYKQETVESDVKVGNLVVKQSENKVLPKNGTVIDGVILDTFSELSKKYMRTLTDKTGRMKLQEWGRLKNKLDTCLEFITRLPGVVICTCHSKTSTLDDGTTRFTPYIDGSTKEDISKWFDFVFYTRTTVDPKTRKREYLWVTSRSEAYDHAKDRTGLLDEEIPQDYQLVINAANKRGFDGVKILVIGSPGSGKTRSLLTLKKESNNGQNNDSK
tara:strand:- start:5154 stop:5915 length:762 start_codon:yes stop_codon:yes gene_type:complete